MTTWISQCQKGKNSPDLNEARDDGDGSGIRWTICKQSASRSRQITTPTPHQSIFVIIIIIITILFAQQYNSSNFRRAGQQRPTRTPTAALKRVMKTVTGYIFYHTSKILQTTKTREINLDPRCSSWCPATVSKHWKHQPAMHTASHTLQ